jgi:hypothetical protein
MSLQFIRDNEGNTTGVFIPIEDWQGLKAKYTELQIQEVQANETLAAWQMRIVDARLDAYYNNPSEVEDFANVLDQIEKER